MYFFRLINDKWYAYKIVENVVQAQYFSKWCFGKDAYGDEKNLNVFWPCENKEKFFNCIAGGKLYFTEEECLGKENFIQAFKGKKRIGSWYSDEESAWDDIKGDNFFCISLWKFITQTQKENVVEKKSVYLKIIKMKDSTWPMVTTIGKVQSLEQGKKLLEELVQWERPFFMTDLGGKVVEITDDHQLIIG